MQKFSAEGCDLIRDTMKSLESAKRRGNGKKERQGRAALIFNPGPLRQQRVRSGGRGKSFKVYSSELPCPGDGGEDFCRSGRASTKENY